MLLDQSLTRFVDVFGKAIKQKNAAIFAGAGLSIPAGFVNWKNLLRDVASELHLDIDKEHDLIAIAQYHLNEHANRHKLNQLLIDEFTKDSTLTTNHHILASLPIQTYWTTNYDKLLEKALDVQGKTADVKLRQEDLSTSNPRRDAIVFKMHGDISLPDQAVLTKDDYEGYNEKRSLFTTALQGDLISKTFLFVGFSFDDPNLEQILSRIRILLGQNKREHYCFFKKADPSEYETFEEFQYAEIKQQLKLKDLKRYSINALLVDSYPIITEVLRSVQKRVLRTNIFISGSAKIYTPRTEGNSLAFVHKLSFALASKGYKIISGVGYGIGGAVINGVLEYVFSTKYRHFDDSLSLRPFPQYVTGAQSKDERNLQYRKEMIGQVGLAIFLFGNKDDGAGGWKNSSNVENEFEIALSKEVIPIPVGATGYTARELWNRVMATPEKYYPSSAAFMTSMEKLGDCSLSDDELIDEILKVTEVLQNHYSK